MRTPAPGIGGLIASALVVAAGAASATAQCGPNWVRAQVPGPAARDWHAMAYDSARGVVVLFGGHDGSGYRNDTWEWNGATWTQRTPPIAPAVRFRHVMAYDSARARVVLFGGTNGNATVAMADTWEWDGASGVWSQRSPASSPAARHSAAMVYDSPRSRAVLFGGQSGSATAIVYGDTWEWDGGNWILAASGGPPPRSSHAMAHDPVRLRTVMYGGSHPRSGPWEYDGTAWVERNAVANQPPTSDQAMLFDPARARVILHGGGLNGPGFTWEFDPAGLWLQPSSSGPMASSGVAMAYDTGRLRGVVFGGRIGQFGPLTGETWEWNGAVSGGPSITLSPQPLFREPGQNAQFTVAAIGTGSLSYRWFRGEQMLSNGGHITGADTDTLTLTGVGLSDNGLYTARITDACGTTASVPARLGVQCYPNCDGSTIPPILNVMDWVCFQGAYAAGCTSPANCYANCDGSTTAPYLNVNDFICFMTRYRQGCF